MLVVCYLMINVTPVYYLGIYVNIYKLAKQNAIAAIYTKIYYHVLSLCTL